MLAKCLAKLREQYFFLKCHFTNDHKKACRTDPWRRFHLKIVPIRASQEKKGKLQTHLFLEMLRTEKTHHLSYQNVIHDVKWKWMEVFFGEGGVKIGFEKIVKKL